MTDEENKAIEAASERGSAELNDRLGGSTFKWEPQYNVRFYSKDGQLVGEFDFSKSPVTFIGDCDESARLFVNAVLQMWGNRIDA